MKIRTDFVTNSSSANYTLALSLISDTGKEAGFRLSVSSETCFSADGDMTGDCISLTPELVDGEVCFDGLPLSSAESIEELGDLLFMSAVIEGWQGPVKDPDGEVLRALLSGKADEGNHKTGKRGEDDDGWDEEEDDGYTVVSVRNVAPKTIFRFLDTCTKNGITPGNLKTVIVKKEKFGSGDSAMWVECDELLSAFESYYEEQGEDRDPDKLQALIDYVKTVPALPVNDNEYALPDEMPCAWEQSDDMLVKEMQKLLDGELSGDYWMGTLTDEYRIDVKKQTIENREVLYFGSL